MLKFCLQRVFLLLCSVHILQFLFGLQSVQKFCLQYAVLLLAVCIFLIQFQFCLQCGGDVFCNVYFMFARNFFYLRCFLFVKAVYPVDHRILYPCFFEISF